MTGTDDPNKKSREDLDYGGGKKSTTAVDKKEDLKSSKCEGGKKKARNKTVDITRLSLSWLQDVVFKVLIAFIQNVICRY
jgi:hypothetical protein